MKVLTRSRSAQGCLVALCAFGLAGCREPENTASAHDVQTMPAPSTQSPARVAMETSKGDPAAPTEAVASEDRSGPSRPARCRIGDGAVQPCTFTPLFGDGSFDIELADRELRVVVRGQQGTAFEVFGPERRVRMEWHYRRDPSDPACWVADLPNSEPSRICAY